MYKLALQISHGNGLKRLGALAFAISVLPITPLSAVYYWRSTVDVVDTDDAYTDGDMETVAPQVAGQVVSLDVDDNQFVKRGTALIHIDPRSFVFNRDQAKGQLDSARARLAAQRFAGEIAGKNFPGAQQAAKAALAAAEAVLIQRQADYNRQRSLPKRATTQQDADAAIYNLRNSQAQVKMMQARLIQAEPVRQQIAEVGENLRNQTGLVRQAQAKLNQTDINLSFTVVRAASDGWVTRRTVEMGDYVQTGQQIMLLVSPRVWITANFKETQLALMRPGQSVKISVVAYPSLKLRGHVDSIQAGTDSVFSTVPTESASANFDKTVQRVPVKIVIDTGLDASVPLPLGISVNTSVLVQ